MTKEQFILLSETITILKLANSTKLQNNDQTQTLKYNRSNNESATTESLL